MTPAPFAAHRLPALGCALVAIVAALGLGACGSGGAATADPGIRSEQPKRPAGRSPAAGPPCPAKLDAFASSLDRLRRQLAVGLSYEQYAAKIKGLRASYDRIPVDHLTLGCLATTGSPAERAFDRYVDAANAWGECLADASCTTATIEPVLQRKWRLASHFLAEVQ
jgi:hypothetical protein